MPPELRKRLRSVLFWAVAAFLVINGCAWDPGYGARHDRKPGKEVERYFGWPACFRAELWRSDHDHEVLFWDWVPPVPLSADMSFVYSSNALLPLLLDALLAAAIAGICGILIWFDERGGDRMPGRAIACGILLAAAAWLIVKFGDATSTYL